MGLSFTFFFLSSYFNRRDQIAYDWLIDSMLCILYEQWHYSYFFKIIPVRVLFKIDGSKLVIGMVHNLAVHFKFPQFEIWQI